MSRASWDRRLRAIESRPTAQRPLRIVGGLPSGADMITALSRAPARTPILPLEDSVTTESIARAKEPTDSGV